MDGASCSRGRHAPRRPDTPRVTGTIQGQFDLGLDHRDRRAQLMGSVRSELGLSATYKLRGGCRPQTDQHRATEDGERPGSRQRRSPRASSVVCTLAVLAMLWPATRVVAVELDGIEAERGAADMEGDWSRPSQCALGRVGAPRGQRRDGASRADRTTRNDGASSRSRSLPATVRSGGRGLLAGHPATRSEQASVDVATRVVRHDQVDHDRGDHVTRPSRAGS